MSHYSTINQSRLLFYVIKREIQQTNRLDFNLNGSKPDKIGILAEQCHDIDISRWKKS